MENDVRYFEKIRDELELKCPSKYVVIKNSEIIGIYDDAEEAYADTIQTEEKGTFIIRYVKDRKIKKQTDNSKKGNGSGVAFLIFASIALLFNLLSVRMYSNGDLIGRDNMNVYAGFFWIIAGIFLFIWIVTLIVRANTKQQKSELNLHKVEIRKIEEQNNKIKKLEQELEELKRKSD